MSLSGLTQSYVPNTLDGLNVIEADQIYIDGQLVDLTNYVPYTGADKPVDVGAQPIRTTYAPVASNDVVNLDTLTNAVAFVDNSIALTYLNKITSSSQTVAGPVTFTNGLQTSANKDVSLASTLIIDPNYQSATVSDGAVTAGSLFGTITNSGGVYQSTSSGDGGVLVLASGLSTGRVRLVINLLVNDSNPVAVSLAGSADGVNPYQSIASNTFPAGTTTFWSYDGTFTLSYPYLILRCNTIAPGVGATVKWYGLTLYQMGVALTNVTMPSQTADRVVVLDASKRLVASGINTTKLGYLDNVGSDLQTQLNAKASTTYVDSQDALKLNLSGSNANQNIVLGAYKVQSSATPSTGNDYINKTYGDATYATTGSLAGYLPLSGGTMTGGIAMGGNFITCSSDPSNNNELTRKSYVDTLIVGRVPRTGDTGLIGDYQTSGSITGAGIISTGGFRGSFYSTSSSGIAYTNSTDKGKWFKIVNVGTTEMRFYLEGHITYYIAGYHAHIHFIASVMFNSQPCIRIVQSSFYGTPIVEQLRLSTDNASIYYQGYIEMYLADNTWADTTINVYGINSAPSGSLYSLVSTKTAGTSTGFTYRAVVTDVLFDINRNDKRLTYASDGVGFHAAGDTSYVRYGPNSSWASYLHVGATTNKVGQAETAQVITTNGNLHLDAGYGRDIYLNYYTNTAGQVGNTYSYGTWSHNSGFVVSGTISSPSRVAITNGDPGDLISKYYGSADRYGIGQYGNGVTRVFTSNAYGSAAVALSWATDNNTAGNAGFIDGLTMNYTGAVNIKGRGTAYAVPTGYMGTGSLTIGSTTHNYGGGTTGWTSSTAALLLECLDNTEIAIHDAGQRVISAIYYQGAQNFLAIGRDMGAGWGSPAYVLVPTSFIANRISVVADDANGRLNVRNPNGSTTHFGYTGDTNYVRMKTIFDTGYVEIGASYVWRAPLDITTSNGTYMGCVRYFDINTNGVGYTCGWSGFSAMADTWGGSRFMAYSDVRKKKDIQPVVNALETIDEIRIVSYNHIDIAQPHNYWGVIAQELEGKYPHLITQSKEFLPNIYQEATAHNCTSCGEFVWLEMTTEQDTAHTGKPIRLFTYDEEGKQEYEETTEVVEVRGKRIKVKKWKKHDEERYVATERVFVYGTCEEDVRTVDKTQFGLLAVAGCQELKHETETQKGMIEALVTRVSVLEQRNAILEAAARQQEDRLKKAEAGLEKMAGLLAQILSK